MSSEIETDKSLLTCWKSKTAVLVRALMLILMGLGAFLLPALGSAQTSPDIQAWQQTIKQTQPPTTGCFQASYPDMQWQRVLCAQPQDVVLPGRLSAGIGGSEIIPLLSPAGGGYAANAVQGPIWAAEGSFLNVTGVTSIIDSVYGQNAYSLQINTNFFSLPDNSDLCSNKINLWICTGWAQFVYMNYNSSTAIRLEYWIFNTNSCPPQWRDTGSGCVREYDMPVPVLPVDGFNNQINFTGKTINGRDIVTLAIGEHVYSESIDSPIKELPLLWQSAQFNVYGLGNYSNVQFNTGSTLTVNTKIDSIFVFYDPPLAPNCQNLVVTGEDNNLYYNSPCCTYAGGKPSIAFVERANNTFNQLTCADLGNNKITPSSNLPYAGIILPSTELNVPNRAVSTFTVVPDSGYKINSVAGCGGSLNGNIFTTAPAAGDCKVTAEFAADTSTGPNYIVTASTNGYNYLGSIAPQGKVAVKSGTAKIFTLMLGWESRIVTVGGTCGGTLIGNTYITSAVTSDCTVVATFAEMAYPVSIFITYVADGTGPHGSVSPSGAVLVNSGDTQTFTLTPEKGYIPSLITTDDKGSVFCDGTLRGNTLSGDTYTTFTYTTNPITAACLVKLQFIPGYIQETYTINASVINGTINPAGNVPVKAGDAQTFTFKPNAGYDFPSITGTCIDHYVSPTTRPTSYTTKPIFANCTIKVEYIRAYTFTSSAGPGGAISPSGAIPTVSNQPIGYTITPNTGYNVSSFRAISPGGGTCTASQLQKQPSGSYYASVYSYDSDCTITVSFAPLSNGNSGGGATSWFWGLGLWGLGTAALWQRRRRKTTRPTTTE